MSTALPEQALCTVAALRAGINSTGSAIGSSDPLVASAEAPKWVELATVRLAITFKVYGVRVVERTETACACGVRPHQA